MPLQRRVHRLHLTGPDEAALHRATNLLEDALRTASLPGDDARVVIVRRLVLPALSSRASAQTLSRVIEEAVRHNCTWVHGSEDRAAHADIVWFAHALEAHSYAAVQLVRGRVLEAWYWPRILAPALVGAPLTLRTLALSVAELPEARVALRQWLATVVAAGGQARLLAALGDADRTRIAHAAGMEWSSILRTVEVPRGPEPPDAKPMQAALLPVAVASGPRSNGAVRRESTDAPTASVRMPRAAQSPEYVASAEAPAAEMPRMTPFRHEASPEVRVDAVSAPSPASPAAMSEAARASGRGDEDRQPWFAPTVAGGAAFLLPVLQRLGYPQWLDAHPDWEDADVARRVVANLLQALDVPADDPAWALACDGTARPNIDAGMHGRWPTMAVPATWNTLHRSGRRVLAGPGLDGAVTTWRTACRRWLRQVPCIGLASLVLREGGVRCSNTHVEFCFDLDAADMRLRRHGLDHDPGWLRWFGRVVQFHFLADRGRHGTS